jgi:hypothetical protein
MSDLEQRVEELESFCFSPDDSVGATVVGLVELMHTTCISIADLFHDVGHSMHKCMHQMGIIAEALKGDPESDHPSLTPPDGEGATIHPFPEREV